MPDARKQPRLVGTSRAFAVVRDTAILAVHNFIYERSLSLREVALAIGMSEATLRLFLNGGHKVPPHRATYRPLLELRLDDEARNAVLDFIDYRQRVAARSFVRREPSERARAELRVISRALDS